MLQTRCVLVLNIILNIPYPCAFTVKDLSLCVLSSQTKMLSCWLAAHKRHGMQTWTGLLAAEWPTLNININIKNP